MFIKKALFEINSDLTSLTAMLCQNRSWKNPILYRKLFVRWSLIKCSSMRCLINFNDEINLQRFHKWEFNIRSKCWSLFHSSEIDKSIRAMTLNRYKPNRISAGLTWLLSFTHDYIHRCLLCCEDNRFKSIWYGKYWYHNIECSNFLRTFFFLILRIWNYDKIDWKLYFDSMCLLTNEKGKTQWRSVGGGRPGRRERLSPLQNQK